MSGCVPAAHLLIDCLAIGQLAGVAWRNIKRFSVQPITNTNADRIDVIKAVKIGDSQLVNAIDHPCITSSDGVEPAAAALAPRCRTKLAPQVVKHLR